MEPSPFLRIAGHAIRRAHQAHDAIFARETEGFDITSPQHAALTAIADHPGIEPKLLGKIVGYDGATLAGLIARLEGKKLVRRSVGRHDRRTRQLTLTPKGTALMARVEERASRVHDVLLAPLTRQEREVFMALLQRVVVNAGFDVEAGYSEIA
jgi:DNA-binding MarR family transcriptional regulator